MTITIDDTYLLYGSSVIVSIITVIPFEYKNTIRRSTNKKLDSNDRIYIGLLVLSNLIPVLNLMVFATFLWIKYESKVHSIFKSIAESVKYTWNIPKNARLLQTLQHENKQLKHDNAIFQKMLQSGLDYETAKAYIENDDEYFRTKYHKVINLDNGCLTIDDHKLWKRK